MGVLPWACQEEGLKLYGLTIPCCVRQDSWRKKGWSAQRVVDLDGGSKGQPTIRGCFASNFIYRLPFHFLFGCFSSSSLADNMLVKGGISSRFSFICHAGRSTASGGDSVFVFLFLAPCALCLVLCALCLRSFLQVSSTRQKLAVGASGALGQPGHLRAWCR